MKTKIFPATPRSGLRAVMKRPKRNFYCVSIFDMEVFGAMTELHVIGNNLPGKFHR